ncbi:protein-serine/threonine phosphatase [Salvia divinorum]|uniref:Protein-serine/threonine phosphatase n=1 Tax=Salvia divinorum TaxID=28513 RepID=A0ABD1IFM2_SALDI
MNGPDIVTVKRERSVSNSETDVIKIKRSHTPDDIMSALLKEEIGKKYDEGENGDDDTGVGDESENCKRERRHVAHGCHLVEGKMKHGMEDCLVATFKKIDGHYLGLYAIFDGHSGCDVAQYLQNHLFHNILNQADFGGVQKKQLGGRMRRQTKISSRINGEAKQVSVDHEALKEKRMVESKGGFVSHKPGNVPRVDGQLAMTRAFGDGRLKAHITSRPDIAIEMIDEHTEFIILASDGVWHVMSNEEAVDCIRGIKDGGEAAKELISQALSRGTKDDISCVVVMFQD